MNNNNEKNKRQEGIDDTAVEKAYSKALEEHQQTINKFATSTPSGELIKEYNNKMSQYESKLGTIELFKSSASSEEAYKALLVNHKAILDDWIAYEQEIFDDLSHL